MSTQLGSCGPVTANVDTGVHSTTIPQGFADAVAIALRIAGCEGEYVCRFGIGGRKGTAALKGLSQVRALSGPNSLSLRLQPGGNDTNRLCTVVLRACDDREVAVERIDSEKPAINALIKGEITSASFEVYASLVEGSRQVDICPMSKLDRSSFVNGLSGPMINGYEPEKHLLRLESGGLRLYFDYDGSSSELRNVAKKIHAGLVGCEAKGDFCLHHVSNFGSFEPELKMAVAQEDVHEIAVYLAHCQFAVASARSPQLTAELYQLFTGQEVRSEAIAKVTAAGEEYRAAAVQANQGEKGTTDQDFDDLLLVRLRELASVRDAEVSLTEQFTQAQEEATASLGRQSKIRQEIEECRKRLEAEEGAEKVAKTRAKQAKEALEQLAPKLELLRQCKEAFGLIQPPVLAEQG